MSDAQKIYQEHIDRVSEAFWAGRFDEVADQVVYPHFMRSRDLEQRIESREELIATARIALESMMRSGGTAYHRVCLEAAFAPDGSDRIAGRHRNFILCGGSYAVEPYESEMHLRLVEGRWHAAGITNDMPLSQVTTLDPARARRMTETEKKRGLAP